MKNSDLTLRGDHGKGKHHRGIFQISGTDIQQPC